MGADCRAGVQFAVLFPVDGEGFCPAHHGPFPGLEVAHRLHVAFAEVVTILANEVERFLDELPSGEDVLSRRIVDDRPWIGHPEYKIPYQHSSDGAMRDAAAGVTCDDEDVGRTAGGPPYEGDAVDGLDDLARPFVVYLEYGKAPPRPSSKAEEGSFGVSFLARLAVFAADYEQVVLVVERMRPHIVVWGRVPALLVSGVP